MVLEEMAQIVEALQQAKRKNVDLPGGGFFDFQHDICYLPWYDREGEIANLLRDANCFFDEETDCWAHG